MNVSRGRIVAISCVLLLTLVATKAQGQGTNTYTDATSSLTLGSWGTAGNWSAGEVPGINYNGNNTIGQNVVIGTITPATAAAGGLVIDTTAVEGPSYSSVDIGSLTFNNATGVNIALASTEELTVTGSITNTTSVTDTLSLPVIAGASSTYSGGQGGLIFSTDSTLTTGTFTIQTTSISGTPTVQVLGGLDMTINATGAGLANTTFGTIGPVITGNQTAITISGTYAGQATVAADEGDIFHLTTGNFANVTVANTSVPIFTDFQLTWVTSLIKKGILLVEPSSSALSNPGATFINTGVVLPIGNDTEFNSVLGTGQGDIVLNGGELLTSDNGTLDTGGTLGAAFSTRSAR